MATQEHTCYKEGEIGAIKATLAGQDAADERIETSLKELSIAMQSNQSENQKEFRAIAASFGKIETILEEQRKTVEQNGKDSKEIKDGLSNLTQRVTTIENDVKANQTDIKTLTEKSSQTDERLSKIEKWIIRIVALLTALGLLIEFFSNLDAIKEKLFPELKQIHVEQKVGK